MKNEYITDKVANYGKDTEDINYNEDIVKIGIWLSLCIFK